MAKVVGTADWRDRIIPQEGIGTLQLGPQAYIDPRDQRYVHDAYQYFLDEAGQRAATETAAPAVQDPTTMIPQTGGGGGAGITAASAVQPTSPATGGGAQNPLTQMVTDPATGQTQTVKQAMTSNAAYTGTPSSPFLASGAAGGASLATPTGSTTTLPSGDVFAGGDYSDVAGTLADPTEKIDFTPETKNIFQKAGQTVSGAAEDLKNAGYNVVQQGKDLIANIGGKSIDIGKTIGAGAMNLIGSKITGIPLLGTAAQMLGEALPKQDPRVGALKELYPDRNTAGTISSGLMAGYNPVSGGIPGISEPTYGLQDAYDKRIGTIENTLKDKYNMTDAEIADVRAGNYKGDVDSDLLQRLTDLDEAKAKEKDRLDLFSGDVDDRDQMLEDIVSQNKAQAEGDAIRQRQLTGDVDFDTPPVTGIEGPPSQISGPQVTAPKGPANILANTGDAFSYLDVSDEDLLGPTQTTAKGPPGVLNPYQAPTPDNILAGAGGFDYMDVSDEDLLGPTPAPVGSGRGGDPRQFMDQQAAVTGIAGPPGQISRAPVTSPGEAEQTMIDLYNEGKIDNLQSAMEDADRLKRGEITNYEKITGQSLGSGGGGGPEGLAYDVFPEGDLQNIIATSPTQKDYNIRATKDLVENLPGGIVRDVLAPAAAGIISLPYDAIQAAQRMKPDSGISGFIDAYKAENPLSSAYERMVGAAGPLAERFEDFNIMGTAQAAETDMEQRLDTPDQRAKEQADAQRAMQEQIAAAERQEAARQAQAEQAAQRAAEQQARAQREMQERIEAAEREEAARRDRENRQREQEQQAAAQRAAEARAARERARRASEEAAARARARHRDNNGGGSGGGSSGGGSRGGGGGGYTGGGWCFDPNTFVQMADGSKKKIKEIQLGDNTKGGEVTGVFQFKAADEIHDYKGVTVAGSHYVKENGKFIMVQDSPLAVKIDKIPVVYSLDTTGRRIFINNIEFADYNGDGIAKGFLHNAGLDLNGFNKEVLRQVENRLI